MTVTMFAPDPNFLIQKVYDKGFDNFSKFAFISKPEDSKGRYLHWNQLKHRQPPSRLICEP